MRDVSKLVCTTVIYFKMATPSNVNKTINDEKITPDAKRVKLFSGPDGEKIDSINESQHDVYVTDKIYRKFN